MLSVIMFESSLKLMWISVNLQSIDYMGQLEKEKKEKMMGKSVVCELHNVNCDDSERIKIYTVVCWLLCEPNEVNISCI